MPLLTRRKIGRRGRPRNPPDPVLAERIRTLREAAGLTQAQLAGGDFSKGFISLLETARTGMSLRAARIFAPRLGVSVDDLLRPEANKSERAGELAILKAEAHLAAGRIDDAQRAAETITTARPDLRARALRIRGRAMLETDRAAEAVPLLDEAVRLFRQHGERELAARTIFDLGRAYARREVHGEAANCFLQCESAIASGDITDASLEMQLLAYLAGIFVSLGDLTSADLRLERARRLAEDVAEPRGVGDLYFNLAFVRQREGDPEGALAFARKALAAYEQLGVRSHVGSVWNTIGWIHLKRGELARAEESLDTAERIAREENDGRLEAYVLQSRAELALARGDAAAAVRSAGSSVDHPHASKRGRAVSLLIRAEAMAAAAAPTADVDAAFAEAVEALRPHGRHLVARAHRAHFRVLSARGMGKEASAAAERAFVALSPDVA